MKYIKKFEMVSNLEDVFYDVDSDSEGMELLNKILNTKTLDELEEVSPMGMDDVIMSSIGDTDEEKLKNVKQEIRDFVFQELFDEEDFIDEFEQPGMDEKSRRNLKNQKIYNFMSKNINLKELDQWFDRMDDDLINKLYDTL